MAQNPVDPFAEFVVEDEDPFAEFVVEEPTPEQVQDSPSVLDSLWKKYFTPKTDLGRRTARRLKEFRQGKEIPFNPLGENLLDFVGSAADEMTSPVNAIPTVLGLGSGLVKGGISSLLNAGARATSAPQAIHGVGNMLHADSTPMERLFGGLETVGGLMGMRGFKKKAPEAIPESIPTQVADDALTALPDVPSRLDYSVSSEKKAREIISSYGETNFDGMSNRQIIDMAEQVEPGWQVKSQKPITTPKELTKPDTVIRMRINEDGTLSPDGVPSIRIDPKTGKVTKSEIDETGVAAAVPIDEPNLAMEVLNLPRAIQASMDLSFPFRQGLGLIHTKGWWKTWPDMVKSFGSDKAFKGVMDSIEARPNFTKGLDAKGNPTPSFAEKSGLAITDSLSTREHEYIGNKFAEMVPLVKGSNRAYLAFANKLRADVFDSLVDDFTKAGLDPRKNADLAKELASYVNNASGRGNLGALEKSVNVLGQLYFSPRLLASRANMMGKGATSLFREGYDLAKNPKAYIAAPPNVRKEYLKSMLGMGSAWATVAGLGAAAGASVNMDPTNSDFAKIRIGDTRIDPGGGFLQFAVLASRLASMQSTSSTTGETKKFADAKTPFDPTAGSTVGNFNYSKSAPLARYIWDWATQVQEKGGSSFDATDATTRLFTPILAQDLMEILNDPNANPAELATLPLNAVGMGTQTYGAGRDYKRRMLGGLGQ